MYHMCVYIDTPICIHIQLNIHYLIRTISNINVQLAADMFKH